MGVLLVSKLNSGSHSLSSDTELFIKQKVKMLKAGNLVTLGFSKFLG